MRIPGKFGSPAMYPSIAPLSASGMGVGATPHGSLGDGYPGLPTEHSMTSSMHTDTRYQPSMDFFDNAGVGSPGGSYLGSVSPPGASPGMRRGLDKRAEQIAPVVPYNVIGAKSMRLGSAIDILYQNAPPSMIVMCRRDAIRAAGEEVLARSANKKIAELATKRSRAWQRYNDKMQQHE